MSARTILKHVYENGGMTKYQFDRIDRVLKERERPHGEWTSNGNDLEAICSVCGEALPCSDEYDYETNFCPNCGADMREGESN